MARTRGASFHQDDGELLDKEGKPIPTSREQFNPVPVNHVIAAAPPQPDTYPVFICDSRSWQRNMDGYEALHLLNMLTGSGLATEMDLEKFNTIPADIRRHFRKELRAVERE